MIAVDGATLIGLAPVMAGIGLTLEVLRCRRRARRGREAAARREAVSALPEDQLYETAERHDGKRFFRFNLVVSEPELCWLFNLGRICRESAEKALPLSLDENQELVDQMKVLEDHFGKYYLEALRLIAEEVMKDEQAYPKVCGGWLG